ncbi:MAG: hypothetical protein EOP53_06035 [Sphingobacteriales bacterium]|nr:MAG: hypothetical protein EOP53_06035 [Sphingobacteriales bacterium]
MQKVFSLIVLFIFLGLSQAFAQDKKFSSTDLGSQEPQLDSLRAYELKLKALGDSMIDGKFQAARINAVVKFIPLLVKTLRYKGSFDYPFDSLPYVKKLTPNDRAFRMYNWTLKYDDGSYRYYCAIHMNRTDSFKLIPLRDYREKMDTTFENVLLDANQWLGAMYYSVIANKIKNKTYYTLLGWDGNQYASDKKIIEVLSFEKGKPKFGAPIFEVNGKTKMRIIFEFSGNATMLLQYIPEHNMITFDHMVPPNPGGEGFLYTYVPDGTYDYFVYKKGKWVWTDDLFNTFKKKIDEAGE